MKILLTGALGYIGSETLLRFANRPDITVYAVDTFKGTTNSELEMMFHKEAIDNDIKAMFEDNITRFGITKNINVFNMTTTEATSTQDYTSGSLCNNGNLQGLIFQNKLIF